MKSVLLVDDVEVTRDAYALVLEWEGFQAFTAGDGQEACELARELRPDLVIMDLNMPVLDGWQAARILKADPHTSHIPLIAVSAWPVSRQDCERTQECGFAAVIMKPLPPSLLLEEIRKQLSHEQEVPRQEPRWLNTRPQSSRGTPVGKPATPSRSSQSARRAAYP